jgi:hypothetical protein
MGHKRGSSGKTQFFMLSTMILRSEVGTVS